VGAANYTDTTASWASGSVTATRNQAGNIFAGGLIGSTTGGSITNCYALGDVLANSTNSASGNAIRVGGIVGMSNVACNVQYNFATGSVIGQTDGSSSIYAGGIVGYIYDTSSAIQNNAALGASVTAKGSGSTIIASRVIGAASNGSQNYAIDTMKTGTANSYTGTPSMSTVTNGTGETTPQGESTSLSSFRKIDIWIDSDKLGFNLTSSGSTTKIWNFNNLSGEGYPRLAWE